MINSVDRLTTNQSNIIIICKFILICAPYMGTLNRVRFK